MNFKVYILWSDVLQKFYVGHTADLEDRLYRHNLGQSIFTSRGVPWKLIWSFDTVDKKEAVQLENKIKKRGAKRFLSDQQRNTGGSSAR